MSSLVDTIGIDLLAAHLTAGIRHASIDDVPAGEAALDDQLLFTLLRSALATPPRPGTAEYAERLAFAQTTPASSQQKASFYPDDYAAAA